MFRFAHGHKSLSKSISEVWMSRKHVNHDQDVVIHMHSAHGLHSALGTILTLPVVKKLCTS